ncbi:uncharacterized protein LOC142617563 isoform X1 [Castanea sativa]|uniref:uncharacterized protein LOC142617563 isoform X1 n=1 Tax=Castanea sativa TaxID=21020 RepID=UPI003F65344A
MAVAAFKSSSRRGNPTATNSNTATPKESRNTSPKKAPIRRSRSVSAFSRTSTNNSTDSTTATTVSSDFLNKRDNPLFWSSSTAKSTPELEPQCSNGGEDSSRGRSVARNVGVGSNKGAGMQAARSLSSFGTADARRNRSVSRGPVSRRRDVTSESEAEQEGNLSKDFKNRRDWSVVSSNTKKGGLVRSSSGVWSSQDSPFRHSDGSTTTLSCSQSANWEDKASTPSSLSGAEDKTIKAVCGKMKSVQGDNVEADTTTNGIYETVRSEVRRAISEIQNDLEIAIRRSKTTDIATTNIADIPPDLVNPGAVELVLDIRREYAIKLEQSLERARKLQADLAVEEHRGHELSRILKEILPDPKTPTVPKSRPGRKTSIERRKMSKRLEEEAMNYFDECVSLSTFDSSDFSSPEDPPFDLATPVGDSILPQASLGASDTNFTKSSLNTKQAQESDIPGQFMNGDDASGLTASSDSKESNLDPVSQDSANSKRSQKFQFTFAGKTTETFELQHDIKKYIRTFEKHDVVSENNRSNCYNMDEYNLQASAQSFLFDKVILKNRIESGSLLVCGGITVSFSPFASII